LSRFFSHISKKVLNQRNGGNCCGFGPQYPRAESG